MHDAVNAVDHLHGSDLRQWARMPRIDPRQGVTVFSPPAPGQGHWVGAPSATYDPESGTFYLYRRIRYPRPVRGGECRIAASQDGLRFTDIWVMSRDQLESSSIERSALVRSFEGDWLLFVSYVDPSDGRWRIDGMRAPSPDSFQPAKRWPVLTAESTGTQGVKDPVVYKSAGEYYLFFTYAHVGAQAEGTAQLRMHESGDAFNTGAVLSRSAVAVSRDGQHFSVLGDVLVPPERGWDRDTTRTTCVVYVPPQFIMFYDGKARVEENYEERCGYAVSFDFARWRRVTVDGPWLVSPWGSESLRYLDVAAAQGRLFAYYEMCLPDGSHELRVNVIEP
ncbi:MAG: hypothetical protein AB1609_01095 [Bacillota bacterium]